MAKANEIISLVSGLTEEHLERLKNYILTRLHIAVNAPEAHIETHACPHCGGKHVIKFGIKNGKQRYSCKDCKKVFLETTKTILYKSKYSLKTWSDYVTCMLSGHTCRYTDKAIGINYKTAFYWRHKILGSLKEVQEILRLHGPLLGKFFDDRIFLDFWGTNQFQIGAPFFLNLTS